MKAAVTDFNGERERERERKLSDGTRRTYVRKISLKATVTDFNDERKKKLSDGVTRARARVR